MKRVRLFSRQLALSLLIGLWLAVPATAETLLRPDHPTQYTVQKGDTLWDISGRFLRSPWRWPEIWNVNPQIANPHLIFPGDRLELVYVDGQPRLQLTSRGVLKLSPQARSEPWDGAIPTIPIGDISPFLSRPYVLDPAQADAAPYIVSFGADHIIGGTGVRAYVRALEESGGKYHVVRPGAPYRDADSDEILGYEAVYIGTVEAMSSGDPATVYFNSSEREAILGDRLIPSSGDVSWTNFTPRQPADDLSGSIIGVKEGVAQIGQFNIVVLDRGAADGLEPGHVLRVDQRGETIRDVVTPDSRDTVKLPDEEAGLLMVFRTFERISFGLVLNAVRPIHVLDRVRTP